MKSIKRVGSPRKNQDKACPLCKSELFRFPLFDGDEQYCVRFSCTECFSFELIEYKCGHSKLLINGIIYKKEKIIKMCQNYIHSGIEEIFNKLKILI